MTAHDLESLSRDHVATSDELSRATSPGGSWREESNNNSLDPTKVARNRPRTFPYLRHLPYDIEDDSLRQDNLQECMEQLYMAISAGDFAPGVVHWTRELRGWLALKFDLTIDQRVRLTKLYYELALAPGLNSNVGERFASMFMVLTKRKHYLKPGRDLILDWRPLFKELKSFVLPNDPGFSQTTNPRGRNIRTLTKFCSFAQHYFDPREILSMLEEFLPYFSTSFPENGFAVVALLNLLLPTAPAPPDSPKLQPQYYLPTLFHLWSLMSRSKTFDVWFIDILSRLARDSLPAKHLTFNEHGIFTGEQSALIFTAILRLLEIPVGQAASPYSTTVDLGAGLALMLDRDQRKHPTAHHVARWIVMSLGPAATGEPDSILARLEGIIQSVETFFHPSNSGSWTKTLAQLVYYLADFFVMRWNRERSGEMEVPEDKRLNEEIRRRFVLALRDVVFMGIYAKSGTAMNFALSSLQNLAYLEPRLILPGALQRIYPAMQGQVEVHRTTSSIRALQILTRTIARTRGFRCHITTLLGLALPGIDANDLEKTLHTLSFVQIVCYNVPLVDMTRDMPENMEPVNGNMLAVSWIQGEMERFEREGAGVSIDYDTELTDEDEDRILRSSTAGLNDFIVSFLGRVITLLENLPDAARVRSGSPEENVVNTLPATFTPLLASLSPELYTVALNKIADFVFKHVIHQARDAMAFICNAFCRVHPKEALEKFVPNLIAAIREEIDDNGAGSSRTTGSEVLPRDRGLVWHISMLSMCVVHVGSDVIDYRRELFDIAVYMQKKCRGIPTVHVSNFIHHLLLNLTVTYTLDYAIYDMKERKRGLGPQDWGKKADPQRLDIHWHVPHAAEIDFAVDLFKSQATGAVEQLRALTSSGSPIKRDGAGKDWSDEVARNLVLIRLLLSGISFLFDIKRCASLEHDSKYNGHLDGDFEMIDATSLEEQTEASIPDDLNLGEADDEDVKPTFQYPTGYPLAQDDPRTKKLYDEIHTIRENIGTVLHDVHEYLVDKQEDDVTSFNALYTAYRSWFIDVGIERSAHVLDRVTRLLAADIHPFKLSGLRKDYPRPLLLRRANLYHLQRLRHNSTPRPRTKLDETLLLDLAHSSVSIYTEIRRTAQSAGESALKVILGSRPLVVPSLLKTLQEAVRTNDYPRIKGAIYSLLFGSIAKTISRDWRFAPTLIRAFIDVTGADRPSVQKLTTGSMLQVMDLGRPTDRMVILDEELVKAIEPRNVTKDLKSIIDKRHEKIKRKRANIDGKQKQLADELVQLARTSHWKKASRTAAILLALGLRFERLVSDSMIDLVTPGAIDTHPRLRGLFGGALVGIFTTVEIRALSGHSYKNFLLEIQDNVPDRIDVEPQRSDPSFTKGYLAGFAQADASYYVDYDYPGWLAWGKSFEASDATKQSDNTAKYDDKERHVRLQVGRLLDRSWFFTFCSYLKQEPRDQADDRFKMTNSLMLLSAFSLVFDGLTPATFEDIKDLVKDTYGDGSDKHQHRATAEILGALLAATTMAMSKEQKTAVWEYAFPIVRGIFRDGLTPENSAYWTTFLHLLLQGNDPRRSWPVVDWLASFRLDMSSNAAFKESSKIQMLQQCIVDVGWHFQLEKPIVEDFLAHLDHPYKGVREAMGQTLAAIFRTRYHESHKDVFSLLEHERAASSIGSRPYEPDEEFTAIITGVFHRIEEWRQARPAGQQTPSPYTSGSKTVMIWLDSALTSHECTQLVKFFPDVFMESLLLMMDIKEDPELQSLSYHVFKHLANVPLRQGEDNTLIASLIRIGRTSTSWHQRLRVLINMQVIFFRGLFLISTQNQRALFDCVSSMLEDTQLEVRLGASTTLSGMVRCSPASLRDEVVSELQKKFTKLLVKNPIPKTRTPGTPTPEHNRLILARHAAVLGLGALIQAFPYTSPPPHWLPEMLATLAVKASADPGMVGKSVKTILADFKKTRQDTWHVDKLAFEPEQLENLEGVLWKSYFA